MSIERELLKELFQYLRFYGATGSLISRIEAELAKPEPEPVAFILKGHTMTGDIADFLSWTTEGMGVVTKVNGYEPIPLYTSPTSRKPLSDNEILTLAKGNNYPSCNQKIVQFARAIEKAHGIK
jgi:hypothetical protein